MAARGPYMVYGTNAVNVQTMISVVTVRGRVYTPTTTCTELTGHVSVDKVNGVAEVSGGAPLGASWAGTLGRLIFVCGATQVTAVVGIGAILLVHGELRLVTSPRKISKKLLNKRYIKCM